ncbi:putative Isochorismatase hydrolase [Candidatus Sulfotelmatomonas gaucii]|uniref:Putative Isochorismatase hydrolase n=1 Tax=Candidatus Sulfuritelmatomonas gaucii TaxID=2043161 RepID=A0A2N9M9Y3_9BACT|nr:putative Isochorismatase hydrolase [Candidatus Sulfotelmatomonas gaucii]
MVSFDLNPKHTALINVDMQNRFVEGYPISAPDGLAVLERINTVAAACRKAGILVVHTSHVFRPDGANLGRLAEFDPPVKSGILNKGSEAAGLHKKLVVDERDVLLDKPRFGAFYGTDLELILRTREIDTVIISGIASNVCCDTTAREASVRDFRVLFLSDGTATHGIGDLSASELHHATCATIGLLFAQVLTVDEVIAKIERGTKAETG